jgi:hypothetical protein
MPVHALSKDWSALASVKQMTFEQDSKADQTSVSLILVVFAQIVRKRHGAFYAYSKDVLARKISAAIRRQFSKRTHIHCIEQPSVVPSLERLICACASEGVSNTQFSGSYIITGFAAFHLHFSIDFFCEIIHFRTNVEARIDTLYSAHLQVPCETICCCLFTLFFW